MKDILFVYGTLMAKLDHPMHGLLAGSAEPLGPAVFQGRLYDLGTYPGAVPSDEPEHQVFGEAWQVGDQVMLLAALDQYEGSEYRRIQAPIRLVERDGEVLAWVYVLEPDIPASRLTRIRSGDYAAHVGE